MYLIDNKGNCFVFEYYLVGELVFRDVVSRVIFYYLYKIVIKFINVYVYLDLWVIDLDCVCDRFFNIINVC